MHAKFWPWGTPYDAIYDHFCVFMSAVISPILKKIHYMRSINPGRHLIFFLIKFPFECRQNHVWRPIFVPSYDHIYKNIHVCKGKGGRDEGRKGGREEGRKGGREKGILERSLALSASLGGRPSPAGGRSTRPEV